MLKKHHGINTRIRTTNKENTYIFNRQKNLELKTKKDHIIVQLIVTIIIHEQSIYTNQTQNYTQTGIVIIYGTIICNLQLVIKQSFYQDNLAP